MIVEAHVKYKKDGFEICNTTYGRFLSDKNRYINPKMENELKIFKKKISNRFANKEISNNFTFPRVPSRDDLHQKQPKNVDQFAPKATT